MKKSIIVIFLLGTLLISPLVLAQNQGQTYSGFYRFIDNAKMLFSFGDRKVMLALNIREKELNSAIVNTKNGEGKEAEQNLERASKKLQYVQSKVSKSTADNVKTNTNEMINRINEEENLPNHFQTYILEEEKTQLTADLSSKVEESEGQSLIRETVKDTESGENRIEVAVEGNDIRTEVMEIEDQIRKIDIQIVGKTIEEVENQIDIPSKTKDRENVKPTPSVVDDDVDDTFVGSNGPGPGIVDDD